MVQDLADSRNRGLILAEALQHVPGFAPGMQAVRLGNPSGSHFNHCYSVQTAAGRFVVRLSPAADAWLAGDRSVERQLHECAAQAGIAPAIVHADGRDRWLITRWVAGRLWSEKCFADATDLGRLARLLQKLHALPPPASGRFDLLYVLGRYVRTLESAGVVDQGAFTPLMKQAAQRWRLSGAEQRAPAILHHDLNAANIIDGPAGIVLIDWECAAVGDPLFDVACVLSYYEIARPGQQLLLQESGLGSVTAGQLESAVWLFDLHTFLWYRERRLRMAASAAELAAEARLLARLNA